MKRKVPYTDEEFETIYGERKVSFDEFCRIFLKATDVNNDWHAGQTLIDKQSRIVSDLTPCNKRWPQIKKELEESRVIYNKNHSKKA